MGFFRREKPIHEQLADEAGLDIDGLGDELRSAAETYRDRIGSDLLFWETDRHTHEWDAVASAEAPDLPGDEVRFVAAEDGTLFVEAELPDGALEPLAVALDGLIDPPYGAVAERWDGDVWTIGAMHVNVVDVPEDIPGDELDLASRDGEVSAVVDGVEKHVTSPTLEAVGKARSTDYVLHASRLDDTLWEVTVYPL